MAFSTDNDLTELQPDILNFGILSFYDEHENAYQDILREIRNKWWSKTGFAGELDETLLTDSQWTRASAYLVLWKYVLPKLTNWVENDRFQNMIDFYRARYGEEIDQVFQDGVEYDADDNGSVSNTEKMPRHSGRLFR
jgi:hypothetical protein